ncbi:hypothetical protein NLG97_g9409 [Lecanicillium saksenae]|uniref:Uncharacterized protein n=1 Tax=Lecanicillium saksenae TaxID=468837 RepID=A0ACC1QG37_9HYPO|nr:hypothetical protein NLG97_g9409 [Lecanicillium saksenae]
MRDLLALFALVGLASAGAISVDIRKDQLSAQVADLVQIHRRSGNDIFDLQALNNLTGGGYYADLGIGTPPQKLSFHLDTGSSDTWVNKKGISFCVEGRPLLGLPPNCMKQFDPEVSKTFQTVSRDFKIGYLDGSSATGDYFNDTVTIQNNITIKNQQLGLAKKSESPTGLMGLGMSVGVASRKVYPTIIDNLVSQGVIETAAFSLYLDSITESHGSFLFGGIDTKKYIGDLATLPLVADDIHQSDNVTSYAVELTGFSADGISTPSLKTKAIFDTGATLVLLPGRIVKPIYDKLGIVTLDGIPTPFIDCGAANKKGGNTKFKFEFNGKTISVPLKEMIINSLADHQDVFRLFKSQFKGFDSVCMFGIASADNYKTQDPDPTSSGASTAEPEYALLGDTFLRSAYVVYDLAGQQVGLAQAYPKSNESNIVTLKANSPLPSIKGMDAPAETKDSAAGITRLHSGVAVAMALIAAAAVAL